MASDLMKARAGKCRKTHARIKLVLSERRRGYENAIDSLPKGLASWRKERWGTSPGPSMVEESIEGVVPEITGIGCEATQAQSQVQ